MELDLTKKIFTAFGLNLSGKSYFVKHAIIPNYRCLVWDPNKEYPAEECDVYQPKSQAFPGSAYEFEQFLIKIVKPRKGKYDLVLVDEANSTFPVNRPLLGESLDFLNNYRHDQWGGLGIGFVCRRPAQLYTDFVSLSHIIFSFGNKGSQDIQRLNMEASGLGDLVKTLANHEYVIVNQDRTYARMPPI
jgi:hypothetical protein